MKKLLLIFLLLSCSVFAQDWQTESSVMQLLQELVKVRANRVDQSQKGWVIVDVPSEYKRYFFVSNTKDPAFPAMFKRSVVKKDDSIVMHTEVTCEGNKEACDSYLEAFHKQDKEIQKSFQ